MTEEEKKVDWNEYYNNLDPMGKQFVDDLAIINRVTNHLFTFVLERGQLYGIVLKFMEIYNIDNLWFNLDDLKTVSKYMLTFTPSEDGNSINAERKLLEE